MPHSIYEAVIEEDSQGKAVSKIYKDGKLVEEKSHENTSLVVYYLRFNSIVKSSKGLSKAQIITNEGRVINLLHNKEGVTDND